MPGAVVWFWRFGVKMCLPRSCVRKAELGYVVTDLVRPPRRKASPGDRQDRGALGAEGDGEGDRSSDQLRAKEGKLDRKSQNTASPRTCAGPVPRACREEVSQRGHPGQRRCRYCPCQTIWCHSHTPAWFLLRGPAWRAGERGERYSSGGDRECLLLPAGVCPSGLCAGVVPSARHLLPFPVHTSHC